MTRPGTWGVEPEFVDSSGNRRRAPAASVAAILEAMGAHGGEATRGGGPVFTRPGGLLPPGAVEVVAETGGTLPVRRGRLPPEIGPGYHRLVTRDDRGTELVVAPVHCHLPDGERGWGWASQLYSLRSRQSWGMGDLGDLRQLARWSSGLGATVVVVNPLHATLPVKPQQASPYFPSSRRFRNPLYIRVAEAPGARRLGDLTAWSRAGTELNRLAEIDRDRIFNLKMEALASCWVAFARSAPKGQWRQFNEYRHARGDSLARYATFCVLAERFGTGWRSWPEEFRHPNSAAVERVATQEEERVMFHQWLQWILDRQLERASGAGIGIVQDLAVGIDPDGADAWDWQHLLAPGLSLGAPPDAFNTQGQTWGAPPFNPHRLRDAGYLPWVETVRANMRHAAGLRIDHVLGLFRSWWVPEGAAAAEGAYVRSRHQELLDIVALESWRAQTYVVGEDLGTSEPLVRQELARRSVLPYRVFWFEKRSPSSYPRRSMAAVTTHDLPTVAGLWSGSDLADQERLGLSPNLAGTAALRRKLARLVSASPAVAESGIIAAVYAQLARAPSLLRVASLEDASAQPRRPNMPGTAGAWPNWSIPLPLRLEELRRNALVKRIAQVLRGDAAGTGPGPKSR